jgi:TetR/AcrR family tetracycline transcriptional repressor
MPRPKSPLISREGAIRAALDVIDQDGLDTFNLGAVARRLNVAAPSLYHHFRDKSEVLTEVARLILLEAEEPSRLPADDWREALVSLAVSARRSILRHPKAAPLLLMHPPRHVALKAYERSLRLFEKKGVPKDLHMAIVSGMDSIVFGAALLTASARAQGIDAFPIFDPSAFPSLTNAIKANPMDEEAVFIRVARSFLDGICPAADART